MSKLGSKTVTISEVTYTEIGNIFPISINMGKETTVISTY